MDYKVNTKKYIKIKGAKMHNLKNINVNIPKKNFVVITHEIINIKDTTEFTIVIPFPVKRFLNLLATEILRRSVIK